MPSLMAQDFSNSVDGQLWAAASLTDWGKQPVLAFSDWLASRLVKTRGGSRQFRQNSVNTYTAIFSTWVSFLEGKGMTVLEVSPATLGEFLAKHSDLEEVSRRRYLQLLDKVYAYLILLGWPHKNPVGTVLAKEPSLGYKPPPGLNPKDKKRLIFQLSQGTDWKAARDRAAVALLWGAGLRCGDCVALNTADLDDEFHIRVRKHGVYRPHSTVVVAWGPWRDWIRAWLSVRQAMAIAGNLVVPASRLGRKYSPSGLYRRLAGISQQAGIEAAQLGANVLRNTFALECLHSGQYSVEDIQEFLGYETLRALERHMPGIWGAPIENPFQGG